MKESETLPGTYWNERTVTVLEAVSIEPGHFVKKSKCVFVLLVLATLHSLNGLHPLINCHQSFVSVYGSFGLPGFFLIVFFLFDGL